MLTHVEIQLVKKQEGLFAVFLATVDILKRAENNLSSPSG